MKFDETKEMGVLYKATKYFLLLMVIPTAYFLYQQEWLYCFFMLLVISIALLTDVGIRVGFGVAKRVLLGYLWISYKLLQPIAWCLEHVPFVRTFVEFIVIISTFVWFRLLISFDSVFRRALRKTSSKLSHPSGSTFSMVNVSDPKLQPLGDFTPTPKGNHFVYPPNFSMNEAISIGNCARLVYEHFPLIQYELKQSGFDVEKTRTIHYKNTHGFVAKKGDDVVVVFRGTEPFNLMHFFTDMHLGMVDLNALNVADEISGGTTAVSCGAKPQEDGEMGKVHYGFVRALRVEKKVPPNRKNSICIDVTDRGQTDDEDFGAVPFVVSAISGFIESLQRLLLRAPTQFAQLLQRVWVSTSEPVDTRFTGRSERDITAYHQAAQAIDELFDVNSSGHVYIAGHSLGGALATVFFAQAIYERKQWAVGGHCKFYTYGQPRVGNEAFSHFMKPYEDNMFRIAYNNDIFPRLPPSKMDMAKYLPIFFFSSKSKFIFNQPYADPPGHLVFIDGTSGRLTVDPPNGLRGISFIKPCGVMNPNIIRRMWNESWLRIVFRILFPFFINDHFGSDYVRMLEYLRLLDGTKKRRWSIIQ